MRRVARALGCLQNDSAAEIESIAVFCDEYPVLGDRERFPVHIEQIRRGGARAVGQAARVEQMPCAAGMDDHGRFGVLGGEDARPSGVIEVNVGDEGVREVHAAETRRESRGEGRGPRFDECRSFTAHKIRGSGLGFSELVRVDRLQPGRGRGLHCVRAARTSRTGRR